MGSERGLYGLKPSFDDGDFALWKIKMQCYLDSDVIDAWDCIEEEWKPPTKRINGEQVEIPREKWSESQRKANGKNSKCMAILLGVLSKRDCAKVLHCTSAYAIWRTLSNYHEGTQEVKNKKMEIMVFEYETFKRKEDEDVTSLTNRLITLVESLKKLGKIYTPLDVNRKILRCLPRK